MQNLQHLTGSIIVLLVTVPYTLSLYCYSVHWDAYSSFIEKVHECEEENGYCASMYDRGAEIWFLRAIPLDRKCYTTSELRSRINCSMEKFKEGCFMDSERNSYKRSERKLPVCICSGDYCNTQENIEKIWLEQNIYEFQAAKKCNNDVGNKSAERLTTDQKSRNISESELEKPTTSQKSQKTLTPDPEKPTTDQKSQNISDSNTEKSTIDQKFQNTSQSEPKKPTGDQKSQATFKPAPEELAATTASLETSTTAAPDELTVTTESDKSTTFENFTLPKPTEVPELTQTDFTLTTAEEGAVTKEEHQTTMENLNEPDASETKEILFGTKGGNITETDAGKMVIPSNMTNLEKISDFIHMTDPNKAVVPAR